MRKILAFALAFTLAAPLAYAGPVQIRRADTVSAAPAQQTTQQAASLVPTAIQLGLGIMDLNRQTRALTAECIPNDAEINWVNMMVREWAKAGAPMLPENSQMQSCERIGHGSFQLAVQNNAASGFRQCFVPFPPTGSNANMVWIGFPQAAKGYRCKGGPGIEGCPENQREWVSNAYDVFAMMDFSDADFLPAETNVLARFREKFDKCSPTKLAARRRELWGGFMMQQAGSLGQSVDMAQTLGQVSGILGQGGGNVGASAQALLPALMQNMR